MVNRMTPRDRILAAINHEPTDYLPCCFSAYSGLRQECKDDEDFVRRQLDAGMDTIISVPDLTIEFHADVTTREWKESAGADGASHARYPTLHCEYQTPAGSLLRTVAQSDDWPDGDHIPFISDHTIARATKQLVTASRDLDALEYLLSPPTSDAIARLEVAAHAAKRLAEKYELPVIGGTAMHVDFSCWLSGIQELVYLCEDDPGFVRRYFELIERWNRERLAIVLDQGVDIVFRRGWYETADWWPPDKHREFVFPALARDAEQVHAAGAKLGYIVSSSSMPLIDSIVEAGVDVLLGVDPAQDRMMNLQELATKTRGRLALWGGVCGYLTIECGDEGAVRREVQEAVRYLGSDSAFILAPVTNVRASTHVARRNVAIMIDEWKRVRGGR